MRRALPLGRALWLEPRAPLPVRWHRFTGNDAREWEGPGAFSLRQLHCSCPFRGRPRRHVPVSGPFGALPTAGL